MAIGGIHIFLALCLAAVVLSPCSTAAKNLGETCTDQADCGNDLYNCKDVCVCIETHVQVGNTCKAKAGSPCTVPTDCVDNASCDPPAAGGKDDGNKTCACKAGFNKDDDGFCSKDLGGPCAKPEDCLSPTMTCGTNNTCICAEGYTEVDNKCKANFGGTCAKPEDCVSPTLTCAADKTCKCAEGYTEVDKKCKANLGGTCAMPEDCLSPTMTCGADKKCTCAEGYTEVDKKCKANLDAECVQTKDCGKPTLTCKAKKCACSDKYFRAGKECKAMVETKCNEAADCVSNTACSGEPGKQVCKCTKTYIDHGDHLCSKDIGTGCTDGSDECGPETMQCKGAKCACKDDLVADGKACKAAVESPCQITGQCVTNSECNAEGKCQCMDQYKKNDKICVQVLNQACEKDEDCSSVALKCTDKKCVCSDGYSAEKDATACSFNLGNQCKTYKDCGIQSLKCSEKMCVCNDGYTEESGQCEYRLDKDCTTDCGSPAMVCGKEKKCKCEGDKYKESEGVCKGVLGALCTNGPDCYSPFTECIGNETVSTCMCKEHYMPSGQKCMADPSFPCDTDNGCSDSHSNCTKSGDQGMICTCLEDYKLNTDTLICSGNSISASLLFVALALAPRLMW